MTITQKRGRFAFHIDAPAHEGALIEAALADARDQLFQAGQSDVTWLDALTHVCGAISWRHTGCQAGPIPRLRSPRH